MRLGKNELKALQFLQKYSGWHSFSKDAVTQRIIKSLKRKRLIKVNKYHQFTISKLGNRYIWERTHGFVLTY